MSAGFKPSKDRHMLALQTANTANAKRIAALEKRNAWLEAALREAIDSVRDMERWDRDTIIARAKAALGET
jgi:hypothetical protein